MDTNPLFELIQLACHSFSNTGSVAVERYFKNTQAQHEHTEI